MTWDPAKKHSSIALSGGDLTASGTTNNGVSVLGVQGLSTGKRYFEVEAAVAELTTVLAGIATDDWSLVFGLSTNIGGGDGSDRVYYRNSGSTNVGYFKDGIKEQEQDATDLSTNGDVYIFAVNLDEHKLWVGRNGVWEGGGDPAAGTGAQITGLNAETFYPAATLDANGQVVGRFAAGDMAYSIPSGFEAWQAPVRVSATHRSRWDLAVLQAVHRSTWGLRVSAPHRTAWSLKVAATHRSVWSASLAATHRSAWSLRVAATHRTPLTAPLTAVHRTVLGYRVSAVHRSTFALLGTVSATHRTAWDGTSPVSATHRCAWSLLALNPVTHTHRSVYSLVLSQVVNITDEPVLYRGAARMEILAATLAIGADAWGWSGTVELADVADYQALARDDAVTLDLYGEQYSLLVDQMELSRDDPGRVRMRLSLISPAAVHAAPRAAKLTKTWSAAVLASAAAQEALGGAGITWDLVDWSIPGARLAVTDAEPIEVARTIAAAGGGVLETLPDGTLRVRPRIPVKVADWPTAGIDQTYTDEADRLSVVEAWRTRERVNRLAVRDVPANTGFLQAELDSRDDGLNKGLSQFEPRDTARFLVHRGPGVTVTATVSSTGTLRAEAPQTYDVEQDLVFSATNEAALSYPAQSVDSVTWLGTSLGALTVGEDRRTLTAAGAGVAIARVSYTVSALAYGLTSPATAGGETDFPVEISITGQAANERGGGARVNIIAQRGAGERQGPDVIDPLLGSLAPALARGRIELDLGEDLQVVRQQTVFRSGVRPGQLIETHDALQGASWRGLITAVEHRASEGRLVTLLEVLRR